LVHGDDGNDKQAEYDKGDEYVDEFVDAGAAVEGYVGIGRLFLGFWCAEVLLENG